MTLTPCDICSCIPANVPNDVFKQSLLALLCEQSSSGLNGEPSVIIPAQVVAFGAVGPFNGAFAATGFVNGTTNPEHLIRYISISNSTGATVRFSFDSSGVPLAGFVANNQVKVIQFPNNRPIVANTDLYLRYSTANGNTGQVIIEGFY